jgi:hypothetical protein
MLQVSASLLGSILSNLLLVLGAKRLAEQQKHVWLVRQDSWMTTASACLQG